VLTYLWQDLNKNNNDKNIKTLVWELDLLELEN
jgi:hypothetical protein